MKRLLIMNIALGLILTGLNTFGFAQNNFLITPDAVGNLKMGMTVAEARRALRGFAFSRTSDGEGLALIEVTRRGRAQFRVYANEFDPAQPIDDNARIEFIEIIDPAYQTAEGVSVNMLLSEVEKRYGQLQGIVLSEIETREFARFARQPQGIDLKVLNRNGQGGIYQNGAMRATQYARSAYVGSIILLGRIGDGDGTDNPVETGFTSRYTDLATDCQTPKGQGGGGDHVSTYCNGYGGYRIHIFDTAKSMEINVQSENGNESIPLASQSLGFDMSDRRIEWRLKDGKPFAVIMRADEYRLGRDGLIRYPVRKTGETLIVKGLPGFEQITGKIDPQRTPDSDEAARKIADDGFSAPNNTAREFETLDITQYNRMIINASRQNQAWVRSPMETAAKLAGEFTEMSGRTMELKSPSAESGNAVTLTITNEGLLDDSVRAERYVFELTKNSGGVWMVNSAQKSWACWPRRGHEGFSAVPCN